MLWDLFGLWFECRCVLPSRLLKYDGKVGNNERFLPVDVSLFDGLLVTVELYIPTASELMLFEGSEV